MKRLLLYLAAALLLASCATRDRDHKIVISVPQQQMFVYNQSSLIAIYPVSTSKFGLGSRRGSYATPLGNLEIERKIGAGQPSGMVFKSRRPTGEIVPPNAPGRDPIVTRILWLNGLDPQNRNARNRCIYIHGTPDEIDLGKPASFGCIRMRSRDILRLFQTVGVGAHVRIQNVPVAQPISLNANVPVISRYQ